jgi:hypothetical protein
MKSLALFLIILLAGCQTQAVPVKPPPVDEGPFDPADPPLSISVTVQSVEYPVQNVSAELTKVVFVWRGIVSNPIYVAGDQRKNVRVGQVFKNCAIWDLYYRGDRPDYIYELDCEPFEFAYLLYFPKNQTISSDPGK